MTTQRHIRHWLERLGRAAERGASLVEYAFLIALIAVVCIVAMRYLGEETGEKYSDVGNSVAQAGT